MRGIIANFVERYQHAKHDVDLRFVDPDADPDAMRAAGVSVDGELEIHYKERSERLKVLSETEFSNALLRLSRTRERIVAFLEGEGERQPLGKANADLAQFVIALADRGVRAVPLPLANTGKVPENADLVVIANPRVALMPPIAQALIDYIERGGNLLWLTEPGEEAGLDALASALSLRVLPGTVVDASGSAFGLDDPSFVRTRQISAARDHAGFRADDAAAAARRARAAGESGVGCEADRCAAPTNPGTKPAASPNPAKRPTRSARIPTPARFAGPLDLGFALSRLSPRPDKREQRVVAIGDGDFLSNSFLGNGGNREFRPARVFDWLLGDDDQISVPDRSAPDRVARALADRARAWLGGVFLVALPLVLAGSGTLLCWRRRRRR